MVSGIIQVVVVIGYLIVQVKLLDNFNCYFVE